MKRQPTAIKLAIVFGIFGVHWFYLRRQRTALLYLLFCWTFVPAIASAFDAIALQYISKEDFNSRYNRRFWI